MIAVRATFLGGPCDGAETLLDHPLPSTIRAEGPVDDVIAELVGGPAHVHAESATYHLVSCADGAALYVVAMNAAIPNGVVYDPAEMDRLRPPGDRFD